MFDSDMYLGLLLVPTTCVCCSFPCVILFSSNHVFYFVDSYSSSGSSFYAVKKDFCIIANAFKIEPVFG